MRGTCKYRRNASNNIHRLSRPAAICTIPEILRVGGLVLTETQRDSTSLRNTVVGCTRGSDWVAIEFTQQFLNGVEEATALVIREGEITREVFHKRRK